LGLLHSHWLLDRLLAGLAHVCWELWNLAAEIDPTWLLGYWLVRLLHSRCLVLNWRLDRLRNDRLVES